MSKAHFKESFLQMPLFEKEAFSEPVGANSKENNYDKLYPFPPTRFQGSKYKITDYIWENIKDIQFNTVLDAFGGTGCVGHMLKRKGKQVTYNDILKFNYVIGKGLIENSKYTLDHKDINFILSKRSDVIYPTFIQDTFKNIFFLDEENAWLDIVVSNIMAIDNEYKKSLAWFALFQSCISKRPYNLFHRANLYVRTNDVKRTFGNKATWDKSFEDHFRFFVEQANKSVFDNGTCCESTNYDALEMPEKKFDLVYIDTPYISRTGVGTDYGDFYHFLDGMLDYENWDSRILRQYKHLPLIGKGDNVWIKKHEIYAAFERLINKFHESILVISYRSDGIPQENEIMCLLKKYKPNVQEVYSKNYKYVLAHNHSEEVLFVAR